MNILIANTWSDYELIDTGDEKRLERFGQVVLVRPDPQIIWKPKLPQSVWQKADAEYIKQTENQGYWKKSDKVPEKWVLSFGQLKMIAKLTNFKHTGIFPEQSVHWEWMKKLIGDRRSKVDDGTFHPLSSTINVLNLFGYTGIASIAAASAGAKVTHVDASKSTIAWARENQQASNLQDKPIRWILDDAIKFCERELRRGVKYDGIIMDPPVFGHGPQGEVWKFSQSFPKLLETCIKLLSDTPLFIIINAYAISSSVLMLENILKDYERILEGTIETGELALKDRSDRVLSTGIYARWTKS